MGALIITESSDDITRFDEEKKLGETGYCLEQRINWTAPSSAASGGDEATFECPGGFLQNLLVIPGSPSPSNQHDIEFGHPRSNSVDVLRGALTDLSNTDAAIFQPSGANDKTPVYLRKGTYTLRVVNNSVNSAQGQLVLELLHI